MRSIKRDLSGEGKRGNKRIEQHIDTIIDQLDMVGRKWMIRNILFQIWMQWAWKNEDEFFGWLDKVALATLEALQFKDVLP